MTIHTRTAPGSLTLDELQQRIQDTEVAVGVLRNIGLTDAGSNRLSQAHRKVGQYTHSVGQGGLFHGSLPGSVDSF